MSFQGFGQGGQPDTNGAPLQINPQSEGVQNGQPLDGQQGGFQVSAPGNDGSAGVSPSSGDMKTTLW